MLYIKYHFLSLQTSSMASCSFLSNNLLVSVKPFLVLPNEFGPEEVIVSRPTLRILILASNGISSSSDESSLLKTAAIEGFFCTVRSLSSDVLLLPEVPNLIAKPNCFLGFSKALEADAMVLSLIEDWGLGTEGGGTDGGLGGKLFGFAPNIGGRILGGGGGILVSGGLI